MYDIECDEHADMSQSKPFEEKLLLSFDVVYDGSFLDDEEYEQAPHLMAWSSLPGRRKHFKPLKWADDSKQLAAKQTMTLHLPFVKRSTDSYLLRSDDTIGLQARVRSYNDVGTATIRSAGEVLIPLGLVVMKANGDQKELKSFKRTLPLTFHTFWDKQGNRIQKGAVEVSNIRAVRASDMQAVTLLIDPDFKPDEFSFFSGNEQMFASVVNNMMERSIAMFTEDAISNGYSFEAASEEVKRVHAPFYNQVAGVLPGFSFLMLPRSKVIPTPGTERHRRVEAWLEKIALYQLTRANMHPDTFIAIVNAQMARTDNSYDHRFTECCAHFGQLLAIPPTSLPYIGDFVRIGRRSGTAKLQTSNRQKTDDEPTLLSEQRYDTHSIPLLSRSAGKLTKGDEYIHNADKQAALHGFVHSEANGGNNANKTDENVRPNESFSSPIDYDSGDCEDFAQLSTHIGNTLALGDWRGSPLVDAFSKIASQYVICMNLGSVLSAALGNENQDKKLPIAEDPTMIIDSVGDQQKKVGAHMWNGCIPLAKFIALVMRSTPNLNAKLLWWKGAVNAEWVAALPHLINEGTGRLVSLLLPEIQYVVTPDIVGGLTIEQFKAHLLRKRLDHDAVRDYLRDKRNSETIGNMTMIRQQAVVDNQPNRRTTTFYRQFVHCYQTSMFLRKGLTNIDHIYSHIGHRTPTAPVEQIGLQFEHNPLIAKFKAPTASSSSSSSSSSSIATETTSGDQSRHPLLHGSSLSPSSTMPVNAEFEGLFNIIEDTPNNNRNSLLDSSKSSATPSECQKFKYGVALEDELQQLLSPTAAIVPGTSLSKREIRVIATILRHSPPFTIPGDFVETQEMHDARIQSALLCNGIDERARMADEDRRFKLLNSLVDKAIGVEPKKRWPNETGSAKWTLVTFFFDSELLTADNIVAAVANDIERHYKSGVVKFARITREESMPHRRTVVVQFLADPTHIAIRK